MINTYSKEEGYVIYNADDSLFTIEYYFIKGTSPKDSFANLKKIESAYNDSGQSIFYISPKKYTIVNDPKEPEKRINALEFAKATKVKVRFNYAACVFLEDDEYLFYMLRESKYEK